jgi:hypothetical protein
MIVMTGIGRALAALSLVAAPGTSAAPALAHDAGGATVSSCRVSGCVSPSAAVPGGTVASAILRHVPGAHVGGRVLLSRSGSAFIATGHRANGAPFIAIVYRGSGAVAIS